MTIVMLFSSVQCQWSSSLAVSLDGSHLDSQLQRCLRQYDGSLAGRSDSPAAGCHRLMIWCFLCSSGIAVNWVRQAARAADTCRDILSLPSSWDRLLAASWCSVGRISSQ